MSRPPGCLPDRVAVSALVRSVPPGLVHEVIEDTRAPAHEQRTRTRAVPAWLTVYVTLALWLWPGEGYQTVWARLVDGLTWAGHHAADAAGDVPAASSIARARDRLGPEPLHALFQRLASPAVEGEEVTLDVTTLGVTAPCEGWGSVRVATLTGPDGGLVDAAWAPGLLPGEEARNRLWAPRRGGVTVAASSEDGLVGRITGGPGIVLRALSADVAAQEVWALACVYQAITERAEGDPVGLSRIPPPLEKSYDS